MSLINYIDIELGGKERRLTFNRGADVEIFDVLQGSTNTLFRCYAIIWGGLIANCFIERKSPDFTFDDVCRWCDKIESEKFLDIMAVYNAVHKYEEEIPKNEAESEDKKKLISKSTKANVLK